MNLLIADDDKTFAQLLAAELRELGCRVTVASDAMQAVMFAVRAPQDAIVLDVQMPGGTGVDALRKLRKSAKTRSIPVVIVSASGDPTIEATLTEMGAAAFFRKPVQAQALHQALRQLTKSSGAGVLAPDPAAATAPDVALPASVDERDRFH